MADVVAVATEQKYRAAKVAQAFLEGLEIGEGLARMLAIAHRADNRYARRLGQLDERRVVAHASHDGLHPTLQVMGHIGYGLALAHVHFARREIHRVSTKLLHAKIEREPGPQRGVLEQQRHRLAFERARRL